MRAKARKMFPSTGNSFNPWELPSLKRDRSAGF
jgi:hypothetical protein